MSKIDIYFVMPDKSIFVSTAESCKEYKLISLGVQRYLTSADIVFCVTNGVVDIYKCKWPLKEFLPKTLTPEEELVYQLKAKRINENI